MSLTAQVDKQVNPLTRPFILSIPCSMIFEFVHAVCDVAVFPGSYAVEQERAVTLT